MYIYSLTLKNIRSYESQTIEFAKGTTLLAGDIGSGKTTILLALEFALFGILRGKTSPQELLRYGVKEGHVILHCMINDHDIYIRRVLKRSGKTIGQVNGELTIDGTTEELVATELKARVLSLLGYPESLVGKSTNLFRYTVYTPQEQVKLILQESSEERKDIIRKIFSIDKYKQIVENTSYYVSDTRERIAHLKGQTDDIKTLREQEQSQQRELETLAKQLPSFKDLFETAKKKMEAQEKSRLSCEKKFQELQSVISQHALLERGLASLQEVLSSYKEREVSLKEIIGKDITPVKFDITKKEKLKLAFEKLAGKKTLLNKQLGELSVKRSQATDLIKQITQLTVCPTCQQDVGTSHKEHIASKQNELLSVVKTKEQHLGEVAQLIAQKEEKLNTLRDQLAEKEKEFIVFTEKQKSLQRYKQELENLTKKITDTLLRIEQNKKDVASLSEKKDFVTKEIQTTKNKLDKLTTSLVQLRNDEREHELRLRDCQTRQEVATKMLTTLQTAILNKEKISKKIEELSEVKSWVQDLFVPLIQTMEKRVLLRVYHEFNNFFIQWFGMLITDDSLQVRLGDDFTPLIQQHGFDTNLNNLSGGEKTSVALAYRLALNKVLNDYFSSLHTKGLLILDEPTDGFSSEQLDRLRDVLLEAQVTQLIIVSHEQRLEALADTIIKLDKSNQVTSIS